MNYKYRGKILEINDARIVYRNFKGEKSIYNSSGARNFSVVIPDNEIADELIEDGWNVKIKDAREEGGTPFMHLPVKVNFDGRPPAIYIKSGDGKPTRLTEDTVKMLDDIDIESVSLDLNPYHWKLKDGKTGVAAYLESMLVVQRVDRFTAMYEDKDDSEDLPF